jgi:deoxyribonuclease-4
MHVGAHVSMANGYLKALEYAESVGCECMQVFAKSPRQWKGPPVNGDAAREFVCARRECGFGALFTHTAYLINLATDDPALRRRSIDALADEIVRGTVLEAAGVVTHIGSDPSGDPKRAARRVATAVREAFELAGGAGSHTRLLLENTAGAGHTFGGSIEELAACLEHAGMPLERLGVCFDSCHAFAFGLPLHTTEGWQAAIDRLKALCGPDALGLVHANDCLFELGSKRDRHAWIGDGFIGEAGFSAMMCLPALREVCACTEMPGEIPEKDRVNLDRLKSYRTSCP